MTVDVQSLTRAQRDRNIMRWAELLAADPLLDLYAPDAEDRAAAIVASVDGRGDIFREYAEATLRIARRKREAEAA